MNINKLIRNSCIKTFAFLGLICFLVILIFYSLFMEKIKLVEGEAFIEDTEELFPYIQDFASSFSYESLDKVIEKNQSLDLGFCIRKTDGTPIWLSEAALEFKSNSDSHIKGFIFLGAGFSEKDYYRLQECAAWRQTINDTTYQYEIFGKNLVRGDGFFYIPGIIEITSYIVEEPLNLNSDLKKLPEIEIIEINNTTNTINASDHRQNYFKTTTLCYLLIVFIGLKHYSPLRKLKSTKTNGYVKTPSY